MLLKPVDDIMTVWILPLKLHVKKYYSNLIELSTTGISLKRMDCVLTYLILVLDIFAFKKSCYTGHPVKISNKCMLSL